MTQCDLKVKGEYPRINVENSPERTARYSTMGALVEVITEKAGQESLAVDADWKRSLSVKVAKDGRTYLVAGVSMSAAPLWNQDSLKSLGWDQN
eukprot:3855405-Pyramimonas_sp.AAC.1